MWNITVPVVPDKVPHIILNVTWPNEDGYRSISDRIWSAVVIITAWDFKWMIWIIPATVVLMSPTPRRRYTHRQRSESFETRIMHVCKRISNGNSKYEYILKEHLIPYFCFLLNLKCHNKVLFKHLFFLPQKVRCLASSFITVQFCSKDA